MLDVLKDKYLDLVDYVLHVLLDINQVLIKPIVYFVHKVHFHLMVHLVFLVYKDQ